jgi:ribose 1,5-bisphosphokinase PhnN
MALSADASVTWPESVALLGLLFFVMFIIGASVAAWLEFRKTKIAAAQDVQLRQLVSRYEQLAETTLDAQQRVAADMSELRSRTSSIEQILRTVE